MLEPMEYLSVVTLYFAGGSLLAATSALMSSRMSFARAAVSWTSGALTVLSVRSRVTSLAGDNVGGRGAPVRIGAGGEAGGSPPPPFFLAGFAIDYMVGRYGMGPYWNGFYALLGAYAGLCARDWWLQPYVAYDPYLTTVAIAGGLLTTVVMVSAVAKR